MPECALVPELARCFRKAGDLA
nr:hypothetical protein [Erythrobacter sp.]